MPAIPGTARQGPPSGGTCAGMTTDEPRRSFAGRSGPDPNRPARRPCATPLFSPNNRGKTFLRPGAACKIGAKTRNAKGLPRSVMAPRRPRTGERKGRNSGAKSDNRGVTGWIRQCRNMPHVLHLSELTSGRIRCEFGNFFVGPEGIRSGSASTQYVVA